MPQPAGTLLPPERAAHGDHVRILEMFGMEAVCDEIAGGKTPGKLCEELGVQRRSLYRWAMGTEERAKLWREAREIAAAAWDELAAETVRKARGKDGVAKARELAHHYRWRARVSNQRDYGDKVQVDQTTLVGDMTDSQLDARLAQLAQKAQQAGAAPPSEPGDADAG